MARTKRVRRAESRELPTLDAGRRVAALESVGAAAKALTDALRVLESDYALYDATVARMRGDHADELAEVRESADEELRGAVASGAAEAARLESALKDLRGEFAEQQRERAAEKAAAEKVAAKEQAAHAATMARLEKERVAAETKLERGHAEALAQRDREHGAKLSAEQVAHAATRSELAAASVKLRKVATELA